MSTFSVRLFFRKSTPKTVFRPGLAFHTKMGGGAHFITKPRFLGKCAATFRLLKRSTFFTPKTQSEGGGPVFGPPPSGPVLNRVSQARARARAHFSEPPRCRFRVRKSVQHLGPHSVAEKNTFSTTFRPRLAIVFQLHDRRNGVAIGHRQDSQLRRGSDKFGSLGRDPNSFARVRAN